MRICIGFLLLSSWLAGTLAITSDKKLPFSPSRKVGHCLYVSGQIPRTPDGKDVRQSIAAETKCVMENIEKQLTKEGFTFADVVSVTVFLRDLEDYAEMNEAYRRFFTGEFPARACVGGVEIVLGFRVEIACIAHKTE